MRVNARYCGASAILMVLVFVAATTGSVPLTMNYQVMLTDDSDQPLVNQQVDLVFRLYESERDGLARWSEEHSVTTNSIGVVSVVLGSVTPLVLEDFSVPLWLEVEVDDEILAPRRELASAPYALHAADSELLGGAGPEAYSPVGHEHDAVYVNEGQVDAVTIDMIAPDVVSSLDGVSNDGGNIDLVAGSNVSIVPDDGANTITISATYVGAGDGHSLDASDGSPVDVVYVDEEGRVGIGTQTPQATLDVDGTARMTGLELPTGAADGHVLTSDASGMGTWQAPAAVPDDDWTVSGGYVYELSRDVGIGIATPVDDLHIHRAGGSASYLRLTNDVTGPGPSDGIKLGVDGTGRGVLEHAESSDFLLINNGTTSLTVQLDGNVGVGTTSPDARLDVEAANGIAGWFKSGGAALFDAALVAEDALGTGGLFKGGHTGVEAKVEPTGDDWYYGVRGLADHTSAGSGTSWGVYGRAQDNNYNYGVDGFAQNGDRSYGVRGMAGGASSRNYGVFGIAGGGDYAYGVYGEAGGGAALVNLAGRFLGSVEVTGTLSKGAGSFKIDHPLDPEGKYLCHSFVESPDMMNVYNGNVVLGPDGTATVELPQWFEALNKDFRYQLTAIGAPGPNLYIAEGVSGDRFRIAGGEPGMTVSWQVTGIRHDRFAEAHRIQVEVDKRPDEMGKYVHPELYGRSAENGIDYIAPDPVDPKLPVR